MPGVMADMATAIRAARVRGAAVERPAMARGVVGPKRAGVRLRARRPGVWTAPETKRKLGITRQRPRTTT